ncbi:MAG: PilT/PilU family type 4a pilus ATPase [Deltaproteobacteria bacterium]|nr:PilT/PilU family type 4a pilus ATPase [Deltaproteobacteria bacterium]
MATVDNWLRALKDRKGSDLHLAAGGLPRMRSDGKLAPLEGEGELTDDALRSLMREIVNEEQWRSYEAEGDLDFAYALEGVARFRGNYLVQERGAAAVFRIVPERILSVEDLGLPPAIATLAELEKGFVLVTGPTGSGKSTTLAAIIDAINRSRACHIVTIEDPVEFVHENQKAILSHREVGSHTGSFAAAVRSAIRQDADVVLVGEMRDRETIGIAITAAEMGLLVFGTLHTNSAVRTVDRMIDAFPAPEQNQVRTSLSESLAGIVAQQLLVSADGNGRVAVHEILLRSTGLPNVIREGATHMLAQLIQSGHAQGMQSMDDALFAAAQDGRVRPFDAYLKASDRARFEPLLSPEERSVA